MKRRDPIGHGKAPFTLPKAKTGPRGCDDITPALWCVLAGAVAFVVVLAVAGILP